MLCEVLPLSQLGGQTKVILPPSARLTQDAVGLVDSDEPLMGRGVTGVKVRMDLQ